MPTLSPSKKKIIRFPIVKIRVSINFMFTIKSAFENISESSEFRFEKSRKFK